MRPWASRTAQKSLQLLRHGFCGRLVESSGPALDPRRFDAGDLRSANDGWGWQTGAREIGDRYIARPRSIVGAGDHRHPDQPEGCELTIGYNQRRTTLFGETVGIGKRDDDYVEGIDAIQRPRHARPRAASCRGSTSCTRS